MSVKLRKRPVIARQARTTDELIEQVKKDIVVTGNKRQNLGAASKAVVSASNSVSIKKPVVKRDSAKQKELQLGEVPVKPQVSAPENRQKKVKETAATTAKTTVSWTIKNIDPAVRLIATEAAITEGENITKWVERVLRDEANRVLRPRSGASKSRQEDYESVALRDTPLGGCMETMSRTLELMQKRLDVLDDRQNNTEVVQRETEIDERLKMLEVREQKQLSGRMLDDIRGQLSKSERRRDPEKPPTILDTFRRIVAKSANIGDD